MKTSQKLLFLFIMLVLVSGFTPKPNTKWVISSGCSLKVAGKTNINQFNCTILNYSNPDTLSFANTNASAPVKVTGAVALDVQNFDCENSMITKDLRKTLKAEAFPKLVIKFVSLSKYPDFDGQPEQINGTVNISLAGVTKKFDVNYKVISGNGKSLTLIGTQNVNFTDFNLSPPRKAGGMIRTKDELKVEFSLKLKVIN